jgi:CrcB protein
LSALLIVGIGGFVGSISRYALSKWADSRRPGWFPAGTFMVNILGSFLLGILWGIGYKDLVWWDTAALLLGTGFLGSFTTFSTFSVEVVGLMSREKFLMAVKYPLVTLLLGISAAALGVILSGVTL